MDSKGHFKPKSLDIKHSLTKLFGMQKVLRDRINYNGTDRFEKLVLALLVELGECANEHRCFKFWSKRQRPRTRGTRFPYVNLEDAQFYNPLLDEYVDGLHFILELGLEIGYKNNYDLEFPYSILGDGVNWFSSTYGSIIDFSRYKGEVEYVCLVNDYLGLGRCLGFEWQQIEEAYFAKNQINHERQDNGY